LLRESHGITNLFGDTYQSGMLPATETPLKPPIALSGSQLTIQAIKLSRTKILSAPCLKTFANILLRNEDVAAIVPFQSELDDPYSYSGQTAEEAFARTLVGDRWWALGTGNSSVPSKTFPALASVTNAYQKCKEMWAIDLQVRAGMSEDDYWYHILQRGEHQEPRMAQDDYQLAVKYFQNLVVRGKWVGLTVDGHVSLVPHLTQVRDQIVVVPGIQRQIILQPSDSGQWDFVGSCYVNGIMSGEIWERGEQVLDVFEIR
jgi:hypothetical protein